MQTNQFHSITYSYLNASVGASFDALYAGYSQDLNIVYDSSGYGNNGIINGSFNVDVPSAHYNISMIFNGSDNAISIPFNNLIHDDFTFTCWFYKTSIGSKSYQTLLGGPSGFELEARNSSGTEPQIVPWNWGKNLATYNFNEWTFVANYWDSWDFTYWKLLYWGLEYSYLAKF